MVLCILYLFDRTYLNSKRPEYDENIHIIKIKKVH